MDALTALAGRGGFSNPVSVQEAWRDFHATTDPLAVWFEQYTVDDPNVFVPRTELRIAYNAAAEREARPSMGQKAFGTAVKRLRPNVTDAQRVVNGKTTWVYVGIGMIHDGQGDSPDSRDSRDNPYLVSIAGARNAEGDAHTYFPQEQDRANPVNPVNSVSDVGAGFARFEEGEL